MKAFHDGSSMGRYAAVVILALVATSVGAQNLVTNGTFDHGIEGWLHWSSTFELAYRADTGSTLDGGSGPGCLEERLYDWRGGGMGPMEEVPVTGGSTYTLDGSRKKGHYFFTVPGSSSGSLSPGLSYVAKPLSEEPGAGVLHVRIRGESREAESAHATQHPRLTRHYKLTLLSLGWW